MPCNVIAQYNFPVHGINDMSTNDRDLELREGAAVAPGVGLMLDDRDFGVVPMPDRELPNLCLRVVFRPGFAVTHGRHILLHAENSFELGLDEDLQIYFAYVDRNGARNRLATDRVQLLGDRVYDVVVEYRSPSINIWVNGQGWGPQPGRQYQGVIPSAADRGVQVGWVQYPNVVISELVVGVYEDPITRGGCPVRC